MTDRKKQCLIDDAREIGDAVLYFGVGVCFDMLREHAPGPVKAVFAVTEIVACGLAGLGVANGVGDLVRDSKNESL